MAQRSTPGPSAMPPVSHVLVDGHVHLHEGLEVPAFLDAAAANLTAAKPAGLAADATGCLLLTESKGVDQFARLAEGMAATGEWQVSATAEPVSLIARRPGALPIVLVAGRQIICRERLEVLALATRAEFDDGLPLRDTVAAIQAAGALAVVPWAFGKWWFGRRRVLEDLLRTVRPGDLFLGDNGNRARLSPPPAPFRAAAEKGLWILPGSDPLPLPAAVDRAGSYGFVLEGRLSESHPARDVVRLIRQQSAQPPTFGKREAAAPFVRNQIAMQLRKRQGPTPEAPAGPRRPAKVLIVAPQPFFTPRGTPYSVYYRTLITAEMGFAVDLLTYGQGEDVDIAGVRIIRIPQLGFLGPVKIGPSWQKLLLDQLIFVWTLALLLRHRYDVVHAHEESVFFLGFLKSIFRFKLVYDMHSSLPEQLRNYRFTTSPLLIGMFEKLEAASLKSADAVITICPELARYAVPLMPAPDRHFLIENSIFDEVRLKRPPAAAGPAPALPADRRVVLYAGTFEIYQGLGLLIEAFATARERYPPAFLVLIGGAPQQVEAVRQHAAGLGLGDDCLIMGQVSQATVRQYVSHAYVLVSPRTHGTNTPLKIYEQLASGVPLVATRILSHTQVLNDDVCFLVEPEPADLAEGLVRALTDETARRRVVANAQRIYETAYARPVYEGKLRNLFQKLGWGAEPLRVLAAARPSRHAGL